MPKTNNNNYQSFNSYQNRNNYYSEARGGDSRMDSKNNYFIEKNKSKKIGEKIFVLKENMFPELNAKEETINNPSSTLNSTNDFSLLFKKKNQEEKDLNLNPPEEKEGWITIKKGEPYIPKKEKNLLEQEENQKVDPYKVFEKLTNIYEKWKKNYIEQWGYDEYEKYYRFPNYDYSYLESEEEEM